MSARSWLAVAFATLLLLSATLRADVVITETTAAKVGSHSATGVRTTFIKGTQMRVEVVQGEEMAATIFDLPAGATINLDDKKRRAEIREISARYAELERQYPRERVTVTLTPTGAAKQVAGSSCTEYTFTIRVPMTKDGKSALNMTGAAWMARDVPGADEYAAFAKAAAAKQLVLGYASSNKILLAITRGQTELYRALADIHGIPYLIDMTMKFDGTLSGLLNKVAAGTRTFTVTRVEVGPLPDSRFLVPDGWKHEKR